MTIVNNCLVTSRKIFFLLILIPLYSFSNDIKQSTIHKALELKLYDSHIWKSMLHVKGGTSSINDPSFLLSYPNFSLKNELITTIESFFETNPNNDSHMKCTYPARFLWLKKVLKLNDSDFPKVECKSFDTYLKKTGMEDLKLVFVSENATNPSSMMGHTFFKISGKDEHDIQREHAVSFFTVIDTVNIPKLLIKSTITGMKGYFLLRPYQEQISRYLKDENRNIWEYDLTLSKFEKELIYFHFWELKDVDIEYLFTGFNCATIVYDMLSISSSKYNENNHLWITPKDVIKDSKKNHRIKNATLTASDEWHIKMLLDELKTSNESRLIQDLKHNDLNDIDQITFSPSYKTKFIEKEFLNVYAGYQYRNHNITGSTLKRIRSEVGSVEDNYAFDLRNYKDPIDTFNDTQTALTYVSENDENYLLFSFIPASHTLYDDNREYFGESELKLLAFDILVKKDKIKLNSLDLYSMKSLLPWDTFTGGLSSSLKINYESHYDENLDPFKAYNISAGLGYTKQYLNDIFVYTLFNAGISYGDSRFYAYAYPELGLLMYEIFDMKTIVNYKYIFNQHGSYEAYHDLKIEQSFFIDKKIRLGLGVDHRSSSEIKKTSYMFSLNYFF